MIDPLRSLAELVRTLTRSRSASRPAAGEVQRHRASGQPDAAADNSTAAVSGIEALRGKLRDRLRALGTRDRRRAREAFVEVVLASELGDAITLDPALAQMVSRVAQQLGDDPATERDLAAMIDELAQESR